MNCLWRRSPATGEGEALFNPRTRKFERPLIVRIGSRWLFRYLVEPGEYFLLKWSYRRDSTRPHLIRIELVRIFPNGRVKHLKRETITKLKLYWRHTILRDFFDMRPREPYQRPKEPPRREYTKNMVAALYELLGFGAGKGFRQRVIERLWPSEGPDSGAKEPREVRACREPGPSREARPEGETEVIEWRKFLLRGLKELDARLRSSDSS